MSNDALVTDITARLAVALDAQSKAKVHDPATNPLHNAHLDDLICGAGILKTSDLLPQRNDYGFVTQNETLNGVVLDGLDARSKRRADARKQANRARAVRIAQINAVADEPTLPDPDRLVRAWQVLRPLVPIVTRAANSKASWARRYLGAVQDDVAQVAMTKMALVLAKGTHDLDLLLIAAQQLGGEIERTNQMPGNQVSDERDKAERKQRKREAKARKWLMGMMNNRVMGALIDLYRERHNLRWENLDILETVMASINGAGDDPAFSAHNASKPPCFVASRMATPGSLDPSVLSMAIAAAITDRGLDRLCELLITDSNLRAADGAFTWTEHAEAVFMATEHGEHKWAAVCQATDHHADGGKHARARAARMYARQQFAFLPWLIRSVIESCDAERVAWRDGHAIMASAFDPDAFAEDGSRKRPGYLRPTIVAADAREAADLVAAHLSRVLSEYDL